VVALDLQHHGDSVSGRIAAQRCADWYAERQERLAARYERFFKARCLLMLGRTDEAVATIAFRAPGDSLHVLYLGLEGVLAAYQGARSQAERIDAWLAELGDPTAVATAEAQRARIALILGDRRRALELLRTSIEKGIPRVSTSMDMHLDPIYDPLRGDTLFERLNRGMD